ncbi:MAG: SemiSWEET transporter [Nitrososphaerota archaeon]|nr:SemiSWEET transporter [Nitrososphaerota archaeon]
MFFITLLGLVAAVLTTYSSVPQFWRAWKTKKTNDISLQMYVLLAIGFAIWLVYGLAIWSIPIIIANGFSVVFASMILSLKLRFG